MTNLKDSGVYWLGEVADDFDIVPSTIVFKERSDKNLEDDVHLTPSQKYGVLPQDKYQEITGGKVMQKLSNSDMKHVEPDDFVIHLRSFQGGIERSQIRGKVSTAYTVLEPRDGVFTGYWRYFLKSAPFIEGMASSTDQLRDGQTINYARFSRLKLLRPPLETQRRIADYLDKEISEMDALIEEFEGLVEILGLRRAAKINALINSVKSVMVPIGILSQVKLGKMLTTEPPTEDGEVRSYLRAAHIQPRGRLDLSVEDKKMWFSPSELEALSLKKDDILIVEGGAGFGRSAILSTDLPTTGFQNSINRVRVDSNLAEPKFVFYVLQGAKEEGLIDMVCDTATIPHFTSEKVSRFRIPIPTLDKQREIAEELDREFERMDALIEESTQLIENLKARKTALITEVVTGRKEV